MHVVDVVGGKLFMTEKDSCRRSSIIKDNKEMSD